MPNSHQFIQATEIVKTLNIKDSETLGRLYGLYKQAIFGDNNTNKPAIYDIRNFTKWNYWTSYKGLTVYNAECQYINLVNTLL